MLFVVATIIFLPVWFLSILSFYMKQLLLTLSKNAEDLIKEFPDFKISGYASYVCMDGDLVATNMNGKIIRITKGQMLKIEDEFVFEVEDSVLIDEGLEVGE